MTKGTYTFPVTPNKELQVKEREKYYLINDHIEGKRKHYYYNRNKQTGNSM